MMQKYVKSVFSKEITHLETLANELGDKVVVDFTVNQLCQASTEFWILPASQTGVNHPKTSNVYGGNVIHTKAAFWIADTICDVWNMKGTTNAIRLCSLSACLLHDLLKFSEALETHGHIAAEKLMKDNPDNHDLVKLICHGVKHHMGQWGEGVDNSWKNPTDARYKKVAQIVHFADMISSRRWLEYYNEKLTDIFRGDNE